MFRKKNREMNSEGEMVRKEKKKRKKMSRRKKKFLIIGSILAIIILSIVAVQAFTGGEKAPQVSTGLIERMDIEQAVSIKGTIQGSESADVVSSLNYEIVSILVSEGDIVERGQILAVLDADTLKNDYQKAVRALEQSRFSYESSKLLYNEGAISKEEYIRSLNTYENDKITVEPFNIFENTNIQSSISGTVTRVNVNLGRYANDTQNNEPMFVIEDLVNLKMDVRISEYDISKIKVGQKVSITAEVIGSDSVEGIVSRISPTGESKDATSKEMVIPVQIDVIKGNVQLIAGVSAKAKIQIEKRNDVLTVPIDAILQDPDTDENFVMYIEGTKLIKVPVELGIEGDFHVEIVSGDLSEGDQVVLSPTFEMTDGMEVIALPQQ